MSKSLSGAQPPWLGFLLHEIVSGTFPTIGRAAKKTATPSNLVLKIIETLPKSANLVSGTVNSRDLEVEFRIVACVLR